MIVKILAAASKDFNGVSYNDKKINKGDGELMAMKNFPSFINQNSSPEEVKDYFKSISKNRRVKNPQFHATISTKFRENSKEELTAIANEFMHELGYGQQPYIVVFHNDTDNNHVHIVTSRVDKSSGRKIKDSFEKLRAQKALIKAEEKVLGKDYAKDMHRLLNYKYANLNQLKLLLESAGFQLANTGATGIYQILKNGVAIQTINQKQIKFSERQKGSIRSKQLRAILHKYKDMYSNKVFKTIDTRHIQDWTSGKAKIQFESNLQNELKKKFGIEIQFNRKDDAKPFGYTLIDHKEGKLYKGSDLVKLNSLFEFTEEFIDKKVFEQLKDFNVNAETREVIIEYYKKQNINISPFMLFDNKTRKSQEQYQGIKKDIRLSLIDKALQNDITLLDIDNKWFVIHPHEHFVGGLKEVVGDWYYQKFVEDGFYTKEMANESDLNIININNLINIMATSSIPKHDPTEDELKKKRKRRR